eukprot:1161216-Pelagomonas_calceolata.AAC.1
MTNSLQHEPYFSPPHHQFKYLTAPSQMECRFCVCMCVCVGGFKALLCEDCNLGESCTGAVHPPRGGNRGAPNLVSDQIMDASHTIPYNWPGSSLDRFIFVSVPVIETYL